MSLKKLFVYLGCIRSLLLPGLFSSCWEWGCCLVGVRRLLTAVASLVAENSWRVVGFSSCSSWTPEHRLHIGGTWALVLHGTWDLPRSGTKPMSPALTGRFFITEPAGKPAVVCLLPFLFVCCADFSSFPFFFFTEFNTFLWFIDFWIITRKVFQLGD